MEARRYHKGTDSSPTTQGEGMSRNCKWEAGEALALLLALCVATALFLRQHRLNKELDLALDNAFTDVCLMGRG